MFTKLEEKEVEMFFMFFVRIGQDRDVVEIDHHELSRYSMKMKHQTRGGGRSIRKVKGKDGVS